VRFGRSVAFYPGEYRVIVSLAGPKESIISAMPEFFKVDSVNCGDEKVWDLDKMDEFRTTLEKGEGKGAAQEWFDTFEKIISSFKLSE